MKLTKTKLKQLIKEELNNVLNETWEPDPSQNPDIARLVASIQTCVAKGGLMKSLQCMPIALELASAVASENWMAAMKAAMKLNECIPETCSRAVAELINALQALSQPQRY
jgi:type III secretion system FlhB-like substrate exporter